MCLAGEGAEGECVVAVAASLRAWEIAQHWDNTLTASVVAMMNGPRHRRTDVTSPARPAPYRRRMRLCCTCRLVGWWLPFWLPMAHGLTSAVVGC